MLKIASPFHAAVAWALLLLGFSAPAFVVFFVSSHYSGPLPKSGTLAFVLVGMVSAVIAVTGVTLFATFWFLYLRFIVGIERTTEVESQLKSVMQIGLMEPIYSYVKRLIYGIPTPDA